MSDFWRDLLLLVVAVNPPAIALASRQALGISRTAAVAAGTVLAIALYLLAAATAEPFLDLLDIPPESFRIGAALVMAPSGMYAIVRATVASAGTGETGWRAGIFPVAIPLLACPAGLAAVISLSADHGTGQGIAPALIAVTAGAAAMLVARRAPRVASDGLARLSGALLVVMAVGLFVDGVQAV